ncbi:MAG: tRNA pseudouridine55 synthase [Gammaproteobacteria bacterium]|jgi:tRNA pseudouridine55 synthase
MTATAMSEARSFARRTARDVTGILLIDKPVGVSSNGALQRVKRLFGARKAGHTGNLDVLASGLLPICFGEATKVCAFLLDSDKTYSAEIKLGEVTTTADREGDIVRRVTDFDVSLEQARSAAAKFVGDIEQVPPMFSALKRNGQRLYKLARKGIEIERAPRPVTIRELEVTELNEDVLSIHVKCSKGTYIRTLAEDIGEVLGCGGHISALRRLEAGPYSVAGALTPDEIEEAISAYGTCEGLDTRLLALDSALQHLSGLQLTDDMAFRVTRGQTIVIEDVLAVGDIRLYGPTREFIGIGMVLDDGRVAPRRLMR